MEGHMQSVFERLIVDFHASPLPQPRPRELKFPAFPSRIRKATVLIGMRRSGKTWALYERMQTLLRDGLDRKKILYINFEDDRLSSMGTDDFQALLDAYFSLYPQHADRGDLHFFFDEIHEVAGWERFIRRLLDQERMQIYITGSSAKMLGKEIASALRGRTYVLEVFPFSFREFLAYHDLAFASPLSSKAFAGLSHHAREYLRTGGFPEVLALPEDLHRTLLQGYMDVVIHRDIEERHNVGHPLVLRDLLRHCLQNAASSMSILKLYQRFKSLGRSISKDSLYAYMDYFQDAYCLFMVSAYSHSLHQRNLLPKKIYPADPGLITAYTIKPETEESSRLENAVFCELRRQTEEIFYYRTKEGGEVDFIALFPNGGKALYQVCVSLSNEETFQRETRSLLSALKETRLSTAIVITLNEEKEIRLAGRRVRCVPISRWLLTQGAFPSR
jgi:uncharacterized protein